MTIRHPLPPGPHGHLLFGSLPSLREQPLGHMRQCEQRYGAVTRLRLPWPLKAVVNVSSPELAERVLVDDAENFGKSQVQRQLVGSILGDGLFLAEGDLWRRERRIVQPALHRSKVLGYLDTFVSCAEAMVRTWRTHEERDVYEDAVDFTLRVAARTMFGAQVEAEVELAREAMESLNQAVQRHLYSRLPLPLEVPTPSSLRVRRATQQLERITRDFVRSRRESGERRDDLLSRLLDARDENGRPLSDRQLRDEAITAFVSGTETTALALGWTLHLLSQAPEVAERMRREVAEVVGPRRVAARHLPSLTFTERVARESMRLYPPFWHVAREAKRDVVLGGYRIPKGTLVLVLQYLIHRNPNYFPQPERFLPDRWTDTFVRTLPRGAYTPFGSGIRKCPGEVFAVTELIAALATIVPQVDIHATSHRPVPRPGASLRPADGIRLRIVKRERDQAVAAP